MTSFVEISEISEVYIRLTTVGTIFFWDCFNSDSHTRAVDGYVLDTLVDTIDPTDTDSLRLYLNEDQIEELGHYIERRNAQVEKAGNAIIALLNREDIALEHASANNLRVWAGSALGSDFDRALSALIESGEVEEVRIQKPSGEIVTVLKNG